MILITEQRQFVTGAVDQRARLMRLDQFAIPLAEAAELFEQFPAAEILGQGAFALRILEQRSRPTSRIVPSASTTSRLSTCGRRGTYAANDSRSCRSR